MGAGHRPRSPARVLEGNPGRGGPARRTEVISLYMYRTAFYGLEAGRAAAVAVVMLSLNLALALAALRLLNRPRRTA